jgi:hypothetical protein
MRHMALLIGLLLSSVTLASAQSLSKTGIYILNGGFVELEDINEIDGDTVRTPAYAFPEILVPKIPAMIWKVINRQQCVFSRSAVDDKSGVSMVMYLNNIIVKETKTLTQEAIYSKVRLKGEDYLVCVFVNGTKTECSRQQDVLVMTDNLPRFYNAIKYLYSNYCRTAERKNAF